MGILDQNNNNEHELYVKAIRALDEHNKVSDHTKVPVTREEQQFAQEVNHCVSARSFGLNISEDRYNAIFKESCN